MVQDSKKSRESFPYLHGTVTLTPKLSYVFCFYYIASDIEEPFLYVVDPLIFSSFVFSGPSRDITNPMALVWSNRVVFLTFNLILCHIYFGYLNQDLNMQHESITTIGVTQILDALI